jgi:hypothetical protein
MRLLLDECVPRPLKWELAEHTVSTIGEMGWAGTQNGELLALIREAAFEAFVTVDQNLAYQQNLRALGVGVVVLVARTNKLPDLLPLVLSLREALRRIQPGELVQISA